MKCKLFILSILSLISLLLILACFGVSIYAWMTYKQLDNSNGSWLFIIMLTFAGLTAFYLILVIIGGYGMHEKRQGYVNFYSVLVFICTLVFLAGAIAAIKITPLMTKENCTDGDLFNSIQDTAMTSIYTLCYNCGCYIPNDTLQSSYNPLIIQSLTLSSPQISNVNTSLPTRTQDCSNWNTTKHSKFATILQSLEVNHKCSGWCRNTNSLFFRFTNLNKGIPMDTCYETYSKFMSQGGLIIEILCFVLTGISVFKLLVACLVKVNERDDDSQVGNYPTDVQGEYGEDKSNANVIFAEKKPEYYPYYQAKFNQYDMNRGHY